MPLKNSEQNWQNYRTLINGNMASCTVNLDIFEQFTPDKFNKIVQVSLPYEADENTMPTLDEHHRVVKELFKILVQASALSELLYAGHIFTVMKPPHFWVCLTSLRKTLKRLRCKRIRIGILTLIFYCHHRWK